MGSQLGPTGEATWDEPLQGVWEHQAVYEVPSPSQAPSAQLRVGSQRPLPDLSQWVRAAEQVWRCHHLVEVQQYYQGLVDAAVDAIIVIDFRGLVRQVNPGACRMFGYSAVEMEGQNIKMLMPSPYADEHDDYLERYTKTGEKKIVGIGRRVPARRKDGSIFPAHLAVSEFENQGQRQFIGTLRDLSDFVEARSRAQVEERKHLSRELHDSVSQALFGIVLGTQAVKNALHHREKAEAALDYVLHLAESGLAEMRTLIFELRPESLESQGLLLCLRQQTQALSRRYQISVELKLPQEEPRLDLSVKHELYRVTMEALHNVAKHAQARHCLVELAEKPGQWLLRVEDDGRGFEPARVPPNRMGISSMRERAAQLGGRLEVHSAPGEGCQLSAHFPASFSAETPPL